MDYSETQLAHGRTVLRHALAWREMNPRAWGYACAIALKDAKGGRRVGSQRLVEIIRARDFTDEAGRPTKVNNDFSPIFARLLIVEHPEVAPFVERRESVYDAIMCDVLPPSCTDCGVRHA